MKKAVIPAQAGIQMIGKSRVVEQRFGFVRYAESLVLLDSRLRGNDDEFFEENNGNC